MCAMMAGMEARITALDVVHRRVLTVEAPRVGRRIYPQIVITCKVLYVYG